MIRAKVLNGIHCITSTPPPTAPPSPSALLLCLPVFVLIARGGEQEATEPQAPQSSDIPTVEVLQRRLKQSELNEEVLTAKIEELQVSYAHLPTHTVHSPRYLRRYLPMHTVQNLLY